MQRIVNGHYADPNSTRDITGITPIEFEFLVRCIQQYHFSITKLIEASPQEQDEFFSSMAETQIAKDMNATVDGIKKAAEKIKQQFETDYGISYNFLKAINQPYPGATY